MSNKLHDKVRAALASRSQWEMRQSRWQEMRHEGLIHRDAPVPA